MSPLARLIITSQAVALVAGQAFGQQVRDLVLDDHTVYALPVSAMRVTTVSFPSSIAAIDGALTTADGKTPGVFQIAHTKGTAYFSARALAKDAETNINVRWNNRTYVFELRESKEPCYSLILRSPNERSAVSRRPLTPNRLLGLLDKAKAFTLLQQYQPEAVRDVEFRDCRATPFVSDCGDYEVRCIEAFRFPAQDTLVFPITVYNKTDKLIEHVPERIEVRIGEHVFTASVADIAGVIAPHAAAAGYVGITGDPNGGRNGLSLKNDFSFVLSRTDASVEAAVKGFEQLEMEELPK